MKKHIDAQGFRESLVNQIRSTLIRTKEDAHDVIRRLARDPKTGVEYLTGREQKELGDGLFELLQQRPTMFFEKDAVRKVADDVTDLTADLISEARREGEGQGRRMARTVLGASAVWGVLEVVEAVYCKLHHIEHFGPFTALEEAGLLMLAIFAYAGFELFFGDRLTKLALSFKQWKVRVERERLISTDVSQAIAARPLVDGSEGGQAAKRPIVQALVVESEPSKAGVTAGNDAATGHRVRAKERAQTRLQGKPAKDAITRTTLTGSPMKVHSETQLARRPRT